MLFVKKNPKYVVSRTFIKNTKIEEKQSFKYLGITIDNELRFSKHSKHVVTKLMSNRSIFYKLRKVLRESQMMKAFRTYVQPIVQYGVLIYWSTTITTMLPLFFFILNHFHPDKLNEALENGPSAQ